MENKFLLTIFFLFLVFVYVFWERILQTFLFLFVPKKETITGKVLELREKKSLLFFTQTDDVNSYFLPVSDKNQELLFCTEYFVDIESNLHQKVFTVKVNESIYGLLEKNQRISLSCEKFGWENSKSYVQMNFYKKKVPFIEET